MAPHSVQIGMLAIDATGSRRYHAVEVRVRVFDVGQHAEGVIAIGQFATGFIAIGQVATGVIAIGQLARGVIAIGMVAGGLISFGMVSVGLVYCGGMLGIGGRRAFGGVLQLVPTLGSQRVVPETTTLEELYATKRWAGWIELVVRPIRAGAAFEHQGQPIALRVDGIARDKIARYARTHPKRTYAYVNVAGSALTCTRLMDSGSSSYARVSFWIGAVIRAALLLGLALVWWVAVYGPLRELLYGP
jgi:hypothetical protein